MTTNPQLEKIRSQADSLGISYHHRAGVDKIKGLIDSHLVTQMDSKASTPAVIPVKVPTAPVVLMEPKAFKAQEAARRRQRAGRLLRCRIQNMNPQKKDWPGEIISVGSAKLGTYKKYIPFHSAEPYHIPQIIYDVLKDKECSAFYNETNRLGHQTRKSRLIKEYAIEVLPQLTQAELKALAAQQALAKGQGD